MTKSKNKKIFVILLVFLIAAVVGCSAGAINYHKSSQFFYSSYKNDLTIAIKASQNYIDDPIVAYSFSGQYYEDIANSYFKEADRDYDIYKSYKQTEIAFIVGATIAFGLVLVCVFKLKKLNKSTDLNSTPLLSESNEIVLENQATFDNEDMDEKTLSILLEQGIITQEEFDSKKKNF